MLLSGSSNIRTGKLGRLVHKLHKVNRVVMVTPSNPHSKTSKTVASRRPIGCCGMHRRRSLAICGYANAPMSYIGLTLRAIIPHHPSIIVNKVGRNSGSSIGIRCSNAVKMIVRKYLGKVSSVKCSLYGRFTSTSFSSSLPCVHHVARRILRRNLPLKVYLGIGFPSATSLGKMHVYHRAGKT